jgi:predicted transcriptional regulator
MSKSSQYKDSRGGHIRLYWDITDSNAWRVLSHADVRIYLALRRKLLGSNNGNINATLKELKHIGMSSSSTLSVALQRLEALGFIEKTRQGGIAYGGKFCSLYRFTDVESYEFPKLGLKASRPTNEWRKFKTLAEAKSAVKNLAGKNTSKVRSSDRSAPTIESKEPNSDSTSEAVDDLLFRLSNKKASVKTKLETA